MQRQCLGVFAKYWTPGRVKTRLAADIGDEDAARIYRLFVQTTLNRLSRIDADLVLAIEPPEAIFTMQSAAPAGWTAVGQAAGDLGQRMRVFFDQMFDRGFRHVVLLGSDSPDIPQAVIENAFEALGACEVVLGPAHDGGYYLIGVSLATPPIFDGMPWSSDQLFRVTVDQLRQNGVKYEVLPEQSDVDDLQDLCDLVNNLATNRGRDDELTWLLGAVLDILPHLAESDAKGSNG